MWDVYVNNVTDNLERNIIKCIHVVLCTATATHTHTHTRTILA